MDNGGIDFKLTSGIECLKSLGYWEGASVINHVKLRLRSVVLSYPVFASSVMDVADYINKHGNAVFSPIVQQAFFRAQRLAIDPELPCGDGSGRKLRDAIDKCLWFEATPRSGCIVYASSPLSTAFVDAAEKEPGVKLLLPPAATTSELAGALHGLTKGRIATMYDAWEEGPLNKHADLLFVSWYDHPAYRLAYGFDTDRTAEEPFYRHELSKVNVPMMYMHAELEVGGFRVESTVGSAASARVCVTFGVVSLWTASKTRRLVFLLPNIDEETKTASAEDLALYGEGQVWDLALANLKKDTVELKIPRFALQTSVLFGPMKSEDQPQTRWSEQMLQGSTYTHAIDGASDDLRVRCMTTTLFKMSGAGDRRPLLPSTSKDKSLQFTFNKGFCFACIDLEGHVMVNGVVSNPLAK